MADRERTYILYDERAFIEGTDKAVVLVACESSKEANGYKGEFGPMCCYSYRCTKKRELVDEQWEWNWNV